MIFGGAAKWNKGIGYPLGWPYGRNKSPRPAFVMGQQSPTAAMGGTTKDHTQRREP